MDKTFSAAVKGFLKCALTTASRLDIELKRLSKEKKNRDQDAVDVFFFSVNLIFIFVFFSMDCAE